ncbi:MULTISPECIES: sugar phosphate isomerase/epimerase family protein [unclassified Rathayibacter]|uniref:sugar phosphate isomerase/epimerase family protein n=1 Tax=unclassified Rathayibacter TaxID=2609250 RepID=UPI0006F61C46|nr:MULTISPECIES: sugar phosphate isomerase/epimerase family protein [unclassified Rathayibacter]KQQ05548.1 xylose isomerase [Rathayibacter sp. Leaf294]KQS13411.1 xylose isomerase [Rathayibacter sp. Leaf185]
MTGVPAHPRLSLNQATIKYAPLATALDVTAAAGYSSIGLWREPVAEVGLAEAVRLVADSGLRVSSLCRGGFFTLVEGPERRVALDDNRRAIDEAAALGAPALVLVAGGLPAGSRDLIGARSRVQDALAELAPAALSAGVQLAIEPLHPMYASDRAVVSTLKQALDLAAPFAPAAVGVVVDTFHIWWDPEVLPQIARAGAEKRIASYQVCDWATPLAADVLLSRHYVGDGVIDFTLLTEAVSAAGYTGDIEVEIFNQDVWDAEYAAVAARVATDFAEQIAPHL